MYESMFESMIDDVECMIDVVFDVDEVLVDDVEVLIDVVMMIDLGCVESSR